MKSKGFIQLSMMVAAIAFLQACGGGGDDSPAEISPPKTVTAVEITATQTTSGSPAAVLSSPVGIALQAGLYAVSYGKGTINSVADKSIWKSGLYNLKTGTYVTHSVYAGNDILGNDVLADGKRILFDPKAFRGQSKDVTYSFFDDAKSKLNSGAYTGTDASFVITQPWTVSLTSEDLTGTSVQSFLLANASLTRPVDVLNVAGNFPSGSTAYRLRYVAMADTFLYGGAWVNVRGQEAFEQSYSCTTTQNLPTKLGMKVNSQGTLDFYEMDATLSCDSDNISSGKFIDSGTWSKKVAAAGFSYIQFAFPASVSMNRYDRRFSDLEYATGIVIVATISADGEWSTSYLVPAGASFRSTNRSLDFIGANSARQAISL